MVRRLICLNNLEVLEVGVQLDAVAAILLLLVLLELVLQLLDVVPVLSARHIGQDSVRVQVERGRLLDSFLAASVRNASSL